MLETSYFVAPVEGQPEFMHVWRVLRDGQDEVTRRYMGQGQGRTPGEAIADCFRLELGSIEADAAELKAGTLGIEVDQAVECDGLWTNPPAPLRLELARMAGMVEQIADRTEEMLEVVQAGTVPAELHQVAVDSLRHAVDMLGAMAARAGSSRRT